LPFLIKVFVIPIERELARLHEGTGLFRSDVAAAQEGCPLTVRVRLDAVIRQFAQPGDHAEDENAQGRHPLLAVDDREFLRILILHQHQRPHVVLRRPPGGEIQQIQPQILPVLFLPRVIPLKRGHPVGSAVPKQVLEIRGAGGKEVRGSHDVGLESSRKIGGTRVSGSAGREEFRQQEVAGAAEGLVAADEILLLGNRILK